MSFELSIVIPKGSQVSRTHVSQELEILFAQYDLADETMFPSQISTEELMLMLEKMMFPFYPTVREPYQAFCNEYNYQADPLDPEVAREFWSLMTERELATVSLWSRHDDNMVKSLYSDLIGFVQKHDLAIFNPQAGELEDLQSELQFPKYWEED